MKKLLNKLQDDTFIRNSFIFFLGSLIVAVVNYAYYPIMGRVLSVEDFGEVQVIATIVLQITIVLNVFGYITINLFTNTKDKKECENRVRDLEGAALVIIAGLSLLALIFNGYIGSYLKFSSIFVLISLVLIFLLNVPFTIKNGWLQANHKFKEMATAAFISATFKLLLALPLIYMGFKIGGALFGLVSATALSLVYVSHRAKTNIKLRDHLGENYFKIILKDEKLKKDLLYGLLIFFALFSINLLYSGDVILVRRFFSTTDSGLYSGIASIGRIIFFSTFAISAVLLPSVKISGKPTDNVKSLQKALGITMLLGGLALLLFYLAPQMIITILIGKNYVAYSGLLFNVGLFILLASLVNVLFVYGIALRKMGISIIGPLAAISVFVASYVNNGSVESIINNFILVNMAALAVTSIYLAFVHKRSKNTLSTVSSEAS